MEIKKFDDIRYEIARLDEKMQLQEKSIKQKFHGLFIQTHPLTIAAQVLTGSFKDVKNDRWVRVFNLVMYAYQQFAETKFLFHWYVSQQLSIARYPYYFLDAKRQGTVRSGISHILFRHL